MIAAIALLSVGLHNGAFACGKLSHLWSLDYGAVTNESLITLHLHGADSLVATVLIDNALQLLLSLLPLTYNGLFTCMLQTREWSKCSQKANFLRVSFPKRDQHSTYRLQLPYSYGIPLLVLSGTLHWLLPQSIFLARVDICDSNDVIDLSSSISTYAFSCVAIITGIILGIIVVAPKNLRGLERYRGHMPLMGSCSAAISAACHPPGSDGDASVHPVMWGTLVENNGKAADGVGHCSSTSFEVERPVKGKRYAGLWDVVDSGTCRSKTRLIKQWDVPSICSINNRFIHHPVFNQ